MKKRSKNKTIDPSNSAVEWIETIIRHRQEEPLLHLNNALNALFWEIGADINEYVNNSQKDDCFDELRVLSTNLQAEFGTFFDMKNIQVMRKFAISCSEKTLKQIRFISWTYIPALVSLNSYEEWIFYVRLILQRELNPAELGNQIDERAFQKSEPVPLMYPDYPFLDLSQSNIFKKSTFLDNFFIEPLVRTIRPLLEPKEKVNTIGGIRLDLNGVADLHSSIQLKIYKLQNIYNKLFNLRFNLSMDEIGRAIKEIYSNQRFTKYLPDDLIRQIALKLNKDYQEIFDVERLNNCVQFAEQFTDMDISITFSSLVRWEHIIHLLPIKNIGEKLFYARLVATEGPSELNLKQKINSDFYRERESYKKKGIADDVMATLVACDTEEMENESPVDAEDEIENSLVTNNIFNNSYFMTFMQAL